VQAAHVPDSIAGAVLIGVDLAAINGGDGWELPIPATFVIGRNGRVRLAHAETDHRERLSPEAIVDALVAADV